MILFILDINPYLVPSSKRETMKKQDKFFLLILILLINKHYSR